MPGGTSGNTVLAVARSGLPMGSVPLSRASPTGGWELPKEPSFKTILEEDPCGTGRSEENVFREVEAQDAKV